MDTKGTPTIHGSVMVGDKFYVAGQEAALATAMKGKSFDRLISKGAVSGNWGQAPAPLPEAPEPAPAETPEPPATPAEAPEAAAAPAPKATKAAKTAKRSPRASKEK